MEHSAAKRIITLLTDFGLKDPYVGIMKGVLLTINPHVTIIDITHDILPQNIEEAAFLIEEYYRFFPPGTIHLAIVDPTVGSKRKPVIVNKENCVFVGPDNGLFTLIYDNAEAHVIENPTFMLKEKSSTFHGRDIFAPAAGHLSTGIHPSAFGKHLSDPVRAGEMFPVKEDDSLKGKIVRFDRFGNAITNIKAGMLKDVFGDRSFEVRIADMTFKTLNKSYFENDVTCLVGSAGYLEFGYFKGNFGEKYRITRGDPVWIKTS